MNIRRIGLHLAKNIFTERGVDEYGKLVVREVAPGSGIGLVCPGVAKFVGMEVCSGAQYWTREFMRLGHDGRIMVSRFVVAYRRCVLGAQVGPLPGPGFRAGRGRTIGMMPRRLTC